ncbi:MAG: hypothetical protein WBC78_00020 [Candidatus Sulfotelmatobacter sp.]
MNQAKRTNVGFAFCLLVICCAVPSRAQQAGGGRAAEAQSKQANTIVCSTATACKAGAIPLFATSGGSADVKDSIMTQGAGAVKINGNETVTGNVVSDGNLSGTNVNASGNVGATTVTTSAATGGVSATMSGTGNSIAAVEGSATATGAAGLPSA